MRFLIPNPFTSHSCGGLFVDQASVLSPTVASIHSPVGLDLVTSTLDTTWAVTNEPAARQVFGVDQVPHGDYIIRRDPHERRTYLDANAILTIPSLFLPTVPRETWISLPFLGEEKLPVQLSETAATDLAMKACVLE